MIGLADPSLAWPTLPLTSVATASVLPDPARSSASSRFFGAFLAIAALTAAMKAALSKPPAGAAAISPALPALARASLLSAGGLAACPASAAFFAAGGCFVAPRRAVVIRAWAARKPGCCSGTGAERGDRGRWDRAAGGEPLHHASACVRPAISAPTAALPAMLSGLQDASSGQSRPGGGPRTRTSRRASAAPRDPVGRQRAAVLGPGPTSSPGPFRVACPAHTDSLGAPRSGGRPVPVHHRGTIVLPLRAAATAEARGRHRTRAAIAHKGSAGCPPTRPSGRTAAGPVGARFPQHLSPRPAGDRPRPRRQHADLPLTGRVRRRGRFRVASASKGSGPPSPPSSGWPRTGPFNTPTLVQNWTEFTSQLRRVRRGLLPRPVRLRATSRTAAATATSSGSGRTTASSGNGGARRQGDRRRPAGACSARYRVVALDAGAPAGRASASTSTAPRARAPTEDMFKLVVRAGRAGARGVRPAEHRPRQGRTSPPRSTPRPRSSGSRRPRPAPRRGAQRRRERQLCTRRRRRPRCRRRG